VDTSASVPIRGTTSPSMDRRNITQPMSTRRRLVLLCPQRSSEARMKLPANETLNRLHLDGFVYPATQMPPPDETMPQDGRISEGPHSDTGWVNMIGVPAVVGPGGFYPDGPRSTWSCQPGPGKMATYSVGRTRMSKPPGPVVRLYSWTRACCPMPDDLLAVLRFRWLDPSLPLVRALSAPLRRHFSFERAR
jgi:hypothetical protein